MGYWITLLATALCATWPVLHQVCTFYLLRFLQLTYAPWWNSGFYGLLGLAVALTAAYHGSIATLTAAFLLSTV